MTYGSELEEFLDLAKIVYTQNFTNESNFIYFGIDGEIWTSNISGDEIGIDEIIIYGSLKNPVFTNISIPAKELHGILSSLEKPEFEQKDDHIIAKDNRTTVKLKTSKYEDPPVDKITRVDWKDLPKLDPKQNKSLLEFIDKNDKFGSRVHCEGGPFTTDVNSIHLLSVYFPYDLSMLPQVWSILEHFTDIAVDKPLLYLYNRDSNVTLVTSCDAPMEIGYIYDIMEDDDPGNYIEIELENIHSSKIVQTFMINTAKADRVVDVSVIAGVMSIVAEDYRKGSVDFRIADKINHSEDVEFSIHPDKLYACFKIGGVMRITDDILWAHSDTEDKFVKITRKEV